MTKDLTSIIIENKKIKENCEKYKIFSDITKKASCANNLEDILKDSFDIIKNYIAIDAISFLKKSTNKNKAKLLTVFENNIDINYFDIFDSLFFSKSIMKNIKDNKIIDSNDLNKEKSKKYLLKKEFLYSLYIPIYYKEEFLGLIIMSRKKFKIFTQKEFQFLTELKNLFNILINNMVKMTKINHDKSILKEKSNYLENILKENFNEIIGESKPLKKLIQEITLVAPTSATVLINGETGVGKELVARAIHNNSKRKNKSFVKVNCSALSESIITSELFGHEKGSFTGAIEKKIGKFELANGGTIFLDEIGELPIDIQVKLLRVLQERELERVGGNKTIALDIRVIAATNKDLKEEVKNKKFREDFYYRLNVFPLIVPPLRERDNDVILLAKYFIKKHSKELSKSICKLSNSSKQFLLSYNFPGNIRELENMIERAVILSGGSHIELNFPEDNQTSTNKNKNEFISLDQVIKNHLRVALELTKGKIHGDNGAAKILDLKPTTLQSKLKKYGLK